MSVLDGLVLGSATACVVVCCLIAVGLPLFGIGFALVVNFGGSGEVAGYVLITLSALMLLVGIILVVIMCVAGSQSTNRTGVTPGGGYDNMTYNEPVSNIGVPMPPPYSPRIHNEAPPSYTQACSSTSAGVAPQILQVTPKSQGSIPFNGTYRTVALYGENQYQLPPLSPALEGAGHSQDMRPPPYTAIV